MDSSILKWVTMHEVEEARDEQHPSLLLPLNNPLAKQMWVQSLGWKDPLEKEMATTPVFLRGKSHGQRSLAGYSPRGCKKVGHD